MRPADRMGKRGAVPEGGKIGGSMSDERNDGGAAFPVKGGMLFYFPKEVEGQVEEIAKAISGSSDGMTLRDYFAGQALSGLYACRELQQGTIEDHRMPIESFEAVMAAQAYAQADAMLKAREG